jgi:hypothetical protein
MAGFTSAAATAMTIRPAKIPATKGSRDRRVMKRFMVL